MIRHAALLAFAAALLAGGAAAQVRLDDSASPRGRIDAPLVLSEQGIPLEQSLLPRLAIVQFGRVAWRLSTAAYVGRDARLYFVVPAFVPGLRSAAAMRVDWGGATRFAPGSLRPGQRQLVWTGRIEGPWIEDAMELKVQVELAAIDDTWARNFSFQPHFEIEVIR